MADSMGRVGCDLIDFENLADADRFLLVERPDSEHAAAIEQIHDHAYVGRNTFRQRVSAADGEGIRFDGDDSVFFVEMGQIAVIGVQTAADDLQDLGRSGEHRFLLERIQRVRHGFAVHLVLMVVRHVQRHGQDAGFAFGIPDAEPGGAEITGLSQRPGHAFVMHGRFFLVHGLFFVLLQFVRLLRRQKVVIRFSFRVFDAGMLEIIGKRLIAVHVAFGLPVLQTDQKRNAVQYPLQKRRSARKKTLRPNQQEQKAEDKKRYGNELADPKLVLSAGRHRAARVRQLGRPGQASVQSRVDIRLVLRIGVAEYEVQRQVFPFVHVFSQVFRRDRDKFQFARITGRGGLFFRRHQAHRGVLYVHQVKGILHRELEILLDLVRFRPFVRQLLQQVQTPLAVLGVERLLEVLVAIFFIPGRDITPYGLGQIIRTVAQPRTYPVVILVFESCPPHDFRVFSELE